MALVFVRVCVGEGIATIPLMLISVEATSQTDSTTKNPEYADGLTKYSSHFDENENKTYLWGPALSGLIWFIKV